MDRRDGGAEPAPSGQEKYTAREMAPWFLAYVVVGALAPHAVFFKGRLRPRPLALYAGVDALGRFAVLQWLAPWAQRQSARFEGARVQLATELGREPTQREIADRLGFPSP